VIGTGRLAQHWQQLPVPVRDVPLALLLAASSLIPAVNSNGTQIGDLPTRPMDAVSLAVVALECAPLLLRRRLPAVCLALVFLGFAADQVLGYHTVAGTALPIALLSTAAHLERHRHATAALTSAGYVLLVVALGLRGAPEGVLGYVTFYLALALAWGAGTWLRQSRAAEAERRVHVAEAARAAERARIAGELHDVVTHHVTAMVVQAEAARYLTAHPDRLDQTLTAVTDTGRTAISDLRHLLDVLDPGHGPRARTPSAGELHDLVEQTRRAGQPVAFTEEGRAAAGTGIAEMIVYRVVQESLTNALKHAHGRSTTVDVRRGDREIAVEIGTDGAGSTAASPGGSGRGLAGLRERVGVLGGEFSAGHRDGGGFVVRARIPVGSAS
jgi:signal transduction histidine kinase